jgi:hypothetical protein
MKGKHFTSGISLTTKIISAFLFASAINFASFAQSTQKEINEQVWKPFIRSFSEGDTDAFMFGIYKTSWKMANGDQGVGYGRFHVALRKESGTWKIFLDTDSSEKGTINEASFLNAPLLLQ